MSVRESVKYQCNQCAHKASQKGHLKRHKMSVHDGVKYQCNQCDYKASQQSNLNPTRGRGGQILPALKKNGDFWHLL